ncbi:MULTISPECIES: hypothetical protein [unclassified Lysinibacillus]|uniref:hypothetical protein n=1 Tax=unclassified Lysinibacillus TaxID=2636778 RepID=UPI00255797CA|nr:MULTISPECIES: hypothetical protein [unclassified Lysinibacillus]MDM5248572.1 hypothetical protein [Lysinibacillus sp. G4S2]
MQLESIFFNSSLSTPFFTILSIVSIAIGLSLTIFGLVKQKKQKNSTLATCCIGLGLLIIITHTIQIVVRVI